MLVVIRVIEYIYEDEETMAEDMSKWTHGMKPNPRMRFQSFHFAPEFKKGDDDARSDVDVTDE